MLHLADEVHEQRGDVPRLLTVPRAPVRDNRTRGLVLRCRLRYWRWSPPRLVVRIVPFPNPTRVITAAIRTGVTTATCAWIPSYSVRVAPGPSCLLRRAPFGMIQWTC